MAAVATMREPAAVPVAMLHPAGAPQEPVADDPMDMAELDAVALGHGKAEVIDDQLASMRLGSCLGAVKSPADHAALVRPDGGIPA